MKAAPQRKGGRPTGVATHSAIGRFRTVRMQLLLPITVATVGLLVLGLMQTQEAIESATDARRARVLAATATATTRFAQELGREAAETAALRQRGGKAGEQLVTAQRARTDAARIKYEDVAGEARRTAPALHAELDAADSLLSQIAIARVAVPTDPAAGAGVDGMYRDVSGALLAVADALPGQITNTDLARYARAVATVASAKHLAAQQRDLLRIVFGRGSFQSGELVRLAQMAGAQQQRLAEFQRVADAHERAEFTQVVRGPDVDNAAKALNKALAADSTPDALNVDADAWYVMQSQSIRRLYMSELNITEDLDATAAKVQTSAIRNAWITGLGTGLLALTALLAAILLAVRTSQRLMRLRHAALAVANEELPAAIRHVETAADPDTVRGTHISSNALLESISAGNGRTKAAGDEISQVAQAFAVVHRQALRLAIDQALLRLDVSGLFMALSRRGQTLIGRQLHLLDEFERAEEDPDTLGRLFQLDHLAARMRRNEENLLVVAGGEPGRREASATAVADVVVAAAAEIEDYQRVEYSGGIEDAIVADAVGDMVHLLAELLENAAVFSPPTTPVRVAARRTVDELMLTIYDNGIGIPPDKLAEANARLTEPGMLTSALAGTMGLLVVARLAARHKVTVELRSGSRGGTAAMVRIPAALLAEAPPVIPRSAHAERPPAVFHTGLDPATQFAPLDPEQVRARLASFARGIAAASRHAR